MKAVFDAIRGNPQHGAYIKSLALWYFYMLEAKAGSGEWTEEGAAVRPAASESVDEWFERLWPLFEPMKSLAIQVRTAPEQFDWDDAVREVHVTINLDSYPKAVLMAELESIIDERIDPRLKTTPGGRKFTVFRAHFQPNAEMDDELVGVLLRRLKILQMRSGTLEAKGARVWPDADPENQKANARDAIKSGRETLAAVRSGRFPYLERPSFARWID